MRNFADARSTTLQVVLKAVMLRRTKDATIDGKPILTLPPRIVNVVPCQFDKAEREFYDALEKKTSLTFNKVRDQRRLVNGKRTLKPKFPCRSVFVSS